MMNSVAPNYERKWHGQTVTYFFNILQGMRHELGHFVDIRVDSNVQRLLKLHQLFSFDAGILDILVNQTIEKRHSLHPEEA